MKKIVALAAMVLLMGCAKYETITEETNYFEGTVGVLYQGSVFNNENINVNYTPLDNNSASITIHKIRFVPQMPVRIDVTIPGISLSHSGGKTVLSCNNVIPYALGGEYPKYIVTDFNGELSGNKLSFSLNFGPYPTTYSGSLLEQ